ncbi:MAG TPA: hypothetical protein VGD65_25820 [Chryseosolibacter sp.]
MRITILFFLVACLVALIAWAWSILPGSLAYFPVQNPKPRYEDIEKIKHFTDLDALKEHAIGLVYNVDEETIARDLITVKAMNILFGTIVLGVIALVVIFLEIAARGRSARQL